MRRKLLVIGLAVAGLTGPAGCREEGPAERAGREVDETVEGLRERSEDTAERARDRLEEAQEDAESALERAREALEPDAEG